MVSIEVSGGRTPHDALHDAVDWGRVVVATVARGVIATLLGLALWAAAPAVIGWLPTTVMTGSMAPRIVPGDVVVSRPVAPAELRVGQVLLADDPDQAGHLRMHRFVDAGPDGSVVTKGDANPERDSTAITRSAVHGVAFLRIPFVGTPIVWMRDGAWSKVALLVLAAAAVLWLATVDGSLRRLAAAVRDEDDDDPDGPGPDAGHGPSPRHCLEAHPSSAPLLRPDGRSGRHALSGPMLSGQVLSRRAHRRQVRRQRRLRGTGGVAAVVLVAGGLGLLLPAQAVAVPFTAKTVNAGPTLTAATAVATTALTCKANGDGSVNIGFTYGGAPGVVSSFDVMMGSTVVGTDVGTVSSVRVVGSGILNLGATVTVAVRTNLGGTWTATSTSTTKIQTALVSTNLSCG
ncbi:S24/S26 family peptidase [Curtobacterium sp. VKM Ac-2865]|uniref:S24/S26 family peptidase n=1 Tax=Curtobacterium sp. VKM Ac-2865 TaxID=2783817 RepID=UPI00188AEE87|nr:S24/S26 family peptidase [Curtobacterium sp. VKM Ac-2865]MBF4582867.1 S24/S26 family peptidase [Curtobacterium sp. VKM Ac-2865]